MRQDEINCAADMLSAADAVVVVASNGFDIADGYNQFSCDEEFLRVFGDLHRACGITSIIQGLLMRWPDRGFDGSSSPGSLPMDTGITSRHLSCGRSTR